MLEWSEQKGNYTDSVIQKLGIIYWIKCENNTASLFFSNDSYNLGNEELLNSNITLDEAKNLAQKHFTSLIKLFI